MSIWDLELSSSDLKTIKLRSLQLLVDIINDVNLVDISSSINTSKFHSNFMVKRKYNNYFVYICEIERKSEYYRGKNISNIKKFSFLIKGSEHFKKELNEVFQGNNWKSRKLENHSLQDIKLRFEKNIEGNSSHIKWIII